MRNILRRVRVRNGIGRSTRSIRNRLSGARGRMSGA
jgi:hypothetical protein